MRIVREAFVRELAPHFAVEEEVLLPALAEAGASDLADRTREDHVMLRGHLAAAEAGDAARLADFAALLERHVRFEENELFPAAERLADEVLEAVAERRPHQRHSTRTSS